MAEYIKREEIREVIKKSSISTRFADIPKSADVRPERHGEWKINCDGYYPYCSECKEEPKNGVMSDFCPHCGAKMSNAETPKAETDISSDMRTKLKLAADMQRVLDDDYKNTCEFIAAQTQKISDFAKEQTRDRLLREFASDVAHQTMKIKVKYFTDIEPLEKIDKGDWIDLRAAADVTLKKGKYALIPLGVGMILPKGYEAHVAPRSSTYKHFKIILANSMGVIDNCYCGDKDQWHFPAVALKDTVIHKNDRICQFRIVKKQPPIEFETVEKLGDVDRGGLGSTGKS